jgi:hypothetical protein
MVTTHYPKSLAVTVAVSSFIAFLAPFAAITCAHAQVTETREAAPMGLIGEPWPPGSELGRAAAISSGDE